WDTLRISAPGPTIALDPASLSPSCTQGNDAAGESFTVENVGSGTLNYTISDDAAWLSVSPSSGTSTGEEDTINVTYSTTGLSAGNYNATITVSDSNATNNPQTIPVSLTVDAPAPVIIRSPSTLSPSCDQGTNATSQ